MTALLEPVRDIAYSRDPAADVRLGNLVVLMSLFKHKSSVAKLSSTNEAQVRQSLQPRDSAAFRPVGHRLARRIEAGLGLPEFSMEQPGGVEPHLADVVARCREAGVEAALPGQAVKSRFPLAQLPAGRGAGGLKPLHTATLQSLESALRRGALSDKACLALMQGWMPDS